MSACRRERVAWLAHLHDVMHRSLWFFLRGVTDQELDWKLHAEANTIRWILGHLLYIEAWTADAIDGSGLYLLERRTSYDPLALEALKAGLAAASARCRERMLALDLDEGALEREIDMLGVMTASLEDVLENHVTHLAGHMYQIRFIRGTYSRAHRTRKGDFDPW